MSLEGVRNWLDDILGINKLSAKQPHFQLHSVQYGTMLFTPGDITSAAPIFDDRPYGSLFYISNTELTVAPSADKAGAEPQLNTHLTVFSAAVQGTAAITTSRMDRKINNAFRFIVHLPF